MNIKQEIKDRADSNTMSQKARKWRKWAFIAFSLASVVISPVFPFALPKIVIDIATVIWMVGGATGIGAQTNKANKFNVKK